MIADGNTLSDGLEMVAENASAFGYNFRAAADETVGQSKRHLVNHAGVALREIVESIHNVSTIVADIAASTGDQAQGIDQVNQALNQLDEVTQQNSALVEENAATARTLDHQAVDMSERVAFFKPDAEVPASPETLHQAA